MHLFLLHPVYKGVFLKCTKILPTKLWDNVEDQNQLKKIVAEKLNVILFFDIEFLNIFSECMKPSGSWLKFCHALMGQPVSREIWIFFLKFFVSLC
jgi:hypothetical protein